MKDRDALLKTAKAPGDARRTMFKSLYENLDAQAAEIIEALTELAPQAGPLRDRRDDDRDDGIVFIRMRPFSWPRLGAEGPQLQARLRRQFERFLASVNVVLRQLPDRDQKKIDEYTDYVHDVIERRTTSYSTVETAVRAARESLAALCAIVRRLDDGNTMPTVIPDTNALYWNPALEQWRTAAQPFNIVLTPPVLAELEAHKIDGRYPARREKAQRLIRQIKEYRRRGRLVEGVPLVQGVSIIAAVGIEPRMADSLPWLDPLVADDRFIATALEYMRQHVCAPVSVVTADVNLQNKLEIARLPFAEPSDLVHEAADRNEDLNK
jgi:hypothetical protein